MKYRKTYKAAVKVIGVADQLLSTLMNIPRTTGG